jgi:hypothetical protein
VGRKLCGEKKCRLETVEATCFEFTFEQLSRVENRKMRTRREQRQGKTSHPDDTNMLVSRKLVKIWFQYVYSERTQNGLHTILRITKHGECYCGKGRMSYPHWRPTSHQEAMDLVYNCFDKENTHGLGWPRAGLGPGF